MSEKRARLAQARVNAGYTQETFAEAMSVDRTTVARWESGRVAPLPFLRPKMTRLLKLEPGELERLLTSEPSSPRAPYAHAGRIEYDLVSHKFLPAFLGDERTTRLLDTIGGGTRSTTIGWAQCRTADVDISDTTTGTLYVLPWGVVVLHVHQRLQPSSISELALWRRASHNSVRQEFNHFLHERLGMRDPCRYVLSCFWLIDSPWSGERLDTAMRLLCMPRALLGTAEAHEPGDLADAGAIEARLFDNGFSPTGQVNCGVDGVSVGWASWSGVAYHPLHLKAALQPDDLIACEVTTQALWCLADEVQQAFLGHDSQYLHTAINVDWRWLRNMRGNATQTAATEPHQIRLLRNAVLATSELPGKLAEAIELLKEQQ